MPSEIMDQRHLSSVCMASAPSTLFSNGIRLLSERQAECWKSDSLPHYHDAEGMPSVPGSRPAGEIGLNSVEPFKYLNLFKDQRSKFGIDKDCMDAERTIRQSTAPWKATGQDSGLQSNPVGCPGSPFVDMSKSGFQFKNDMLSSSLSEAFSRELSLSSMDPSCGHSTNIANSNLEEDESFESLEEIEARIIGNLLPDDDDLISGVTDGIEYIPRHNFDDVEDDLFCSIGGMELEADDGLRGNKILDPAVGVRNFQQEVLSGTFSGERLHVDHPSRSLIVRNISGNVEDSELRVVFEQYGSIHTLYTACKHRGFVMISYYDLRSARNAMKALQNKPLKNRKLDVQFSIPKDNQFESDINQGTLEILNLDFSVSNDDLLQIFGIYGDIKEIRETPHKRHHKFIEFYDVRAAEAALHSLNGSGIPGKKIKLIPSRPGVPRWSATQQPSPDLEQREPAGCCQLESPCHYPPSGDHGLHSSLHTQHRFLDNNFGVTASPIRVSPASIKSNPAELELSHSLGDRNTGFPSPYSRSLPEYHDCVTSGLPFNSLSAMSSMSMNINARPVNAFENIHIQNAGSEGANSHPFEYNHAFGTSANGNGCLHGHRNAWSNASPYHHHHQQQQQQLQQSQGPMIWPNSPSLVNIPASPSQSRGLPRSPSPMVNTFLPLRHHHVGSAPSANPSLWDRRTYVRDGAASGPSSSHIGGTILDPSRYSPQQRCQTFHGRNPMIPVPTQFDSPSDRSRSRRSDASSNQADSRKQYELDIERIIRREDSRTTLMIKNIPNKYTSKMLLAAIDENHHGTYDFIYCLLISSFLSIVCLPPLQNKCNVGYAFINMIDPRKIIPFFQTFNGKKWEKFNSEKVASLAYARIQGKAALIAHFQNSSLMNEDKRCRPILFQTDGPNAGDQEPFPMGINIRSRNGKPRAAGNEQNQMGSSGGLPSVNGEESPNGTDSSPGSVKALD
ncbi:unnamed protein product [Spirodela intermedia]|uniref:RRM domain-containing protein n=1 Tax=Spirodela intermedia TaxID=51605 RepID=A0A7I8JG09_SPIIN|nr:unnamed protein product [Spirodela intermedia]CAA6668322.1 unnamed protein product [Spirodela intermedia]